MWAKSAHIDIDLFVLLMVKVEGHDYGNNLSADGCDGRTGNFQSWESEQTKDHNRVENDIDNCTGSLGNHIVDCFSGRLHQSFKSDLQEEMCIRDRPWTSEAIQFQPK